MRIALGIYRLQPRGGLEDNCIRIAEELVRRGHEPTLFAAGPYPDLPMPIKSIAPRHRALSNNGRLAAFARAFAQASKGRFDRTVTFQPVPGADVLFLADTLRDRADAPLLKRLTPRFRTFARLERACFSATARTRIIGLALPQMRAYVERYPASRERIAIIPPTMPESRQRPQLRAELRAPARQEMGFGAGTQVWLWLGLQPEIKGLDRVIEALPNHVDAHLLVVGVEAEGRKIRRHLARAAQLGVADRIHCLGFVPTHRFFSALAAADVLAHPARLDVTGSVILEALVNGLPVVATDICGFAARIEESGAGKVIHGPFDAGLFSRLLGEVCGSGNAEFSRKGIAYGAKPELYSGIGVACDLIEADSWQPRSDL